MSTNFLEWALFYTEWNNYSYAAHKGRFFKKKLITRMHIFQLMKYKHKGVSDSINFDDTNFSSVGLLNVPNFRRL